MYKLTKTDVVIRVADNTAIPFDEANRDYQAYLEWVAAGNTPNPYVEPEKPVPQVISRFQALAILHQAGHLEATEVMIAAADTMTKLAYHNAQEFRRTSPLLNQLAAALGLTKEQLDQLFIDAVNIEA